MAHNINDKENNPQLRTYSLFKKEFIIEPYLLQVVDYKLRKVIARFRLSNHDLKVETGRHCKPKIPLEQRICRLCKENVIEDETHFLMCCPAYSQLRETLITIRNQDGLINDFISVVSCDKTCFYLGKLLHKMFKLRKSKLGENKQSYNCDRYTVIFPAVYL